MREQERPGLDHLSQVALAQRIRQGVECQTASQRAAEIT